MSETLAIVIPAMNEEENIHSLLKEIISLDIGNIGEIIVVDDGSSDRTSGRVQSIKSNDNRIRLLRHSERAGQSASIRTGIKAAISPLIVTMDGDGQNDPADIPLLLRQWQGNFPYLLIAGQRKERKDGHLKRLTSYAGNSIRNLLLQDGVTDTGCSLKLFRREDYLSIPYFNHMHRFLPALFLRERGKIVLVSVSHRPRRSGISKYGFWDRLGAGIFDVFGVLWLKVRACRKITVTEE